ncbi:MAG: hypothetical protein ICV64_11650 [Thermoleophilia bacterium]|nr:hypothetical protein [Thermoleophilia bacterium]
MTRRLLLLVLFLGALALAVAGWIVEGARWALAAPGRALRTLLAGGGAQREARGDAAAPPAPAPRA